MRCEVSTFPPATAAGSWAFTIVPLGRSHESASSGRGSGHQIVEQATKHINTADCVMAATALTLPRIAVRSR